MNTPIPPCPYCGSDEGGPVLAHDGWRIKCDFCDALGPRGTSAGEALRLYSQRHTPPDEAPTFGPEHDVTITDPESRGEP
jgi:hypothetical protein